MRRVNAVSVPAQVARWDWRGLLLGLVIFVISLPLWIH